MKLAAILKILIPDTKSGQHKLLSIIIKVHSFNIDLLLVSGVSSSSKYTVVRPIKVIAAILWMT